LPGWQMSRFINPFFGPINANFDVIKKAKEMRDKSKIPRIRTMKKILKKIKAKRKDYI
jgi:hypothetical protein